jgi:hypothetical protein
MTQRVSLMEQELCTLPKHLSSPPVFSGVRVTPSLVLYVCSVDCYLYFWTFPLGHCGVCCSSIYGFWLPLWFLSDTRCVNLVINPVISHERGKDREVRTTSGAYPSFATQIFHSGQPSHDDFNLTKRNLGLVASLLAAALYHGNPDRNQ